MTAGTTSPTNYRILTLPSTGTLYVNGTAATANQLITAAQATQLTFTAATGYFGTTSFTYAPADAANGVGDAAAYAIPVSSAACGSTNSVLDFSRRTIGEDWTNHASVAVNASNITTGNYTSIGASGGNSFVIENNAALPGPSLAWRQVNTGSDPGTNGNGNTSTVTFTFDQPVSNLSLSIQDIDKNITTTQAFTDALTLDGYSTAASTTPIALTAANFALASVNTFSGSNTVTGTGNSDNTADGNIVVTFTTPVQRLTLTFKNIAPYTSATISRTHTVGITSMTWCRLAPVANNVTTATLPSTAGQVGISSLASTVDGTVATYTIVTIPNATTQGTLYYNSTGTTYTAVAAGRTLTAAQAASLRFAPVSTASGNTTFTYTVQDTNGQTSANTATYIIPVNNTPCATNTNTFAYSTRTAGEDWKAHNPIPAPTGSGLTTLGTSGYGTQGPITTNTLAVATLNGAQTLQWSTDYSSLAANTSTVTFNFNRAVSNVVVRVQDIDTGTGFLDQVVFTGANGSAPITPVLGPAGGTTSTNTVAINGNTATGTAANNTSATTATVLAYFPSPITSITLTYSNLSTTQADPANNLVGIDLLQFCRLAPVANNVTTPTLLSSVGAASIASLSSTVDGASVGSYTLTSIPNATTQGVLSYNSTGTTYTNITSATQVLTPAQAASLRFTPVAGSSGNVTFGYNVTDEVGVASTTPAVYTIPVSNTTCAGTATVNFATQTVGDDWRAHAALAVPTGSTMTTLGSNGYTTPSTATTSTLSVTAGTATTNINSVQTLAWITDYASQAANTSTVTFTFNRPVSNFAVRVQDIDKNETSDTNGNITSAFNDQVTFVGANGTTAVLPSLAAVGTANKVLINGNVATGTTNITNTTDGTVMAYFASPITSLTLTYRNISTYSTDPTTNGIGIDLMNFCRLAPVATNVANTSRPSGQGAAAINSLSATADGTIASYTISAVPAASQGTYYVNGVVLNTTNFPNLVLTPTQATQLTFAPAAGFSGSAGFSYTATDDAGLVSNVATYTVPVTATGGAGTPAPCATPGKDGAATALSGTVNTYFAGTASVAAKSTATSIPVAASVGASTGITPGDLLLIIQMQGADVNNTNDTNYGANAGTGGGNLSNTNFIAGTYEYVVATGSLPAGTAGSISVAALANSYATAPATATSPRKSFQVVRIPQYSSITLGGQLNALAWNGSAGGILAIDVAGTLNLNGQTLNAAAAGFRGGAGFRYTGAAGTANTDYRTSNSLNTSAPAGNGAGANGTKGEGTAGTPRYTLLSLTAATRTDNAANTAIFTSGVTDGYPGGDNGKGAPGNAGGGGTDDTPTGNSINDGGAGGANGGAGGLGGWPRINTNGGLINTNNRAVGGASFAPVSSSRLVMGGGGGAGTSNDGNGDTNRTGIYSSGAPGGGLILVRTGSVSGTGTANASGDGGYLLTGANGNNDGAGGGGAGGTVLITANTTAGLANLTVLATGGKGNSNSNSTDVAHGPGGGGGGGVILANGALNSASSAVGGVAGTIVSSDTYTGTTYGAAPGAPGVTNTQISTSIANSTAGYNCTADVATTITGPASANTGQPTGNFTATFTNLGAATALNATQTVTLPTGAGLTAAQQATIKAAYPAVVFTITGTGTTTATTINFGTTTLASGASNSFVFAYTAPTTAATYATTSTTSTSSIEAGQTANNTASVSTVVATAADVTVSLTGPSTLNAGQPTGTYMATFTNEGPSTAANVARTIALPAGATLTAAQLAAIPGATATTTGTGASAVTTINFGPLTTLASDASSAVSFAFTAPAATGTSTLTGTISTTTSQGSNVAPDQATLALTTMATADVMAAITASATATTGTFNVTFSNNGPQAAAGVTRTVQLPAGLTGVTVTGSDAGSYNATTGVVTYTTSPTTIAAGSSLTSAISYTLSSSAAPVAATASVSTTTNEAGLLTNNTATAVMLAEFDLATTLTGPTTTIAGSPTMLYVTTSNNGPNDAPVASQTVTIPSATQLTDVYITNGGTYTYNATTKVGTVTFPDVTNLPSGQTITNSISFAAPVSNFAPTALVAINTGETSTTNNTAYLNGSATSTSVAVTGATTTKVNEATTITADAAIVNAGSVVTFTVTATNDGALNSTSVTGVAEQVQLLPGLTTSTLTVGGVSGTLVSNIITFAAPGGTTTYNTTTGVLTYPVLATQTSGATYTFDKLAVTVPANTGNNGQLLATASVSTSVSDPIPSDNTSSVVVKVKTTADLAATLTGPSSTPAGQLASYSATFTNKGTGSATTVTETAQLPAGLTGVVVQDASGNVITNAYNATTGLVTFPALANDPAGTSQVYGISFPAPGQTFVVSTAISSGTTDNVTTNNSALVRTTVTPTADVAVYVSGPATAVAGNAVTYAVTAVNNGPDAATTVQPTLQLPAGLTGSGTVVTNSDGSSNNGVVLTGGGTYNATTGVVTFTAANLASGDSRVGLVTFTMPSNPTNGLVSGAATVSTASTDLVASNNTAGITTSVAPATSDMADLTTSITPPASPPTAGSLVSYTLSFSNNGPAAATKVMPTAYLPAGLSGVVVRDANGIAVPNAYNATTGQITFPTIDSQAANNLTSYTVVFTAPANAVVISASSVSSNTSDPNPANNIVDSTLNITPSYDAVTSLTGPTSAQPGSSNTYTVTTSNNGPSTAANTITQTVTLPAGVTVVAGSISGGGTQSGNTITFPAINSEAAGPNGAVANTFSVVMPATGSLLLTATVTVGTTNTTPESNVNNNQATLTTTPANQAPVAQNVWNTLQSARGNSSTTGLPISPLNATDADGTISSYTITSIPSTVQGMLYYNGTAVLAGQTVAASGLSFIPTAGYVGNATFTYTATDNGSAVSNTALYTIPVAADQAAVYATFNTTKGGSNPYANGDVLAQVVDPNAAVYNSTGVIFSSVGVLQTGAANGLAITGTNAVLTSGTLPNGVSLDPITGRIYVSDATKLPTTAQTYTVSVTTTDRNGGVTVVPVTLTLGAQPLPVTLVEFTAQAVANRDALLSWHTASEQHNDHFEVERSFDGTSFTKVGQVAGHGTTSAASAYTFSDAGVAAKASGPVYYRLRQVDTDGTATYSPQRTVSFTKVALVKVTLFPNPVQTSTNLDLSALAATASYQAQLLDATGRQVRAWTLAGGVLQPLNVADLASGSYLLVVTGQQPDGSLLKQTLRMTKE